MWQATWSYDEVIAQARASGEDLLDYLAAELSCRWTRDYLTMSKRTTDVIVFNYDSFEYVFDAYQQPTPHDPASGELPVEGRLVAAYGLSVHKTSRRDDSRLRGITLAPVPGDEGCYDRGHFIGHSIGGTVDGNEANVFLQLRASNRSGYRRMENYCRKYPGTFCFSRPVYDNVTAHPARVEFGMLRQDGKLWVDSFANRPGHV